MWPPGPAWKTAVFRSSTGSRLFDRIFAEGTRPRSTGCSRRPRAVFLSAMPSYSRNRLASPSRDHSDAPVILLAPPPHPPSRDEEVRLLRQQLRRGLCVVEEPVDLLEVSLGHRVPPARLGQHCSSTTPRGVTASLSPQTATVRPRRRLTVSTKIEAVSQHRHASISTGTAAIVMRSRGVIGDRRRG